MVKNLIALYDNEIHRVNSPFNVDSKDINPGGGTVGKFRENGQKQGNPRYANYVVVNFD